MKSLYLVGGTMGVGKTTTCQILKRKLSNSVFLDGDWCWDMHPFQVTEETKHMVMDNICYLLNRFIACSSIDNIIFCWVMHEQAIIDEIVSRLDRSDCAILPISLVCNAKALEIRLQQDVDTGVRDADVISRSIARIPLYDALDTLKIDVSKISPAEAADSIIQKCSRF